MNAENQTTFALIPITFIGSVLNFSILIAIYKLPALNNSFGYLTANQAIVDALHSVIFLLYFCPMVILDQPIMKSYSFIVGCFLLFCYELSVLTHFLISINRFCAVWVPLKYEKWFSRKNTSSIIILLWIFEVALAIVFYQILCHVAYLEEIHFIQFTNTKFCGFVAWYDDFVKNSVIIAIVVCVDISTVLRVHHVTKKVRGDNKFTLRDLRFLRQSVFQGTVFLLELVTYFFIPQYFHNQWIIFLGTSFMWVSIHAIDGMIVVMCNPEVRNFLMGRKNVYQITGPQNTTVPERTREMSNI
ncbi:G-protein coupled receptors family 1 profile domain-containing protein [Caenorhabditis elegans]|uniref:G-protein coupled receptors family 1 profile domain-containing protein n=1 Tax=Caenorhabditis elegans TaxID=6239 RepID=Q966G7_CAEEL|nr:G-protein coupled receptors family 1 profile domain-containing protein [Caenorhabditis elegans]CCD83343.1 G-protein coupled receptors family 1 profile domain-containing protein [Caenorhabditis elegans]|eukprot:NP_504895.2 Serpentine Receptor, class X [Caenorhabditis elegans]